MGEGFARAEDERDTPDAGERDHGINDAAEQGGRAAEEVRDEVELEQTDAAPVQRADDNKYQSDAIYDHHNFEISFRKESTERLSDRFPRKIPLVVVCPAARGIMQSKQAQKMDFLSNPKSEKIGLTNRQSSRFSLDKRREKMYTKKANTSKKRLIVVSPTF